MVLGLDFIPIIKLTGMSDDVIILSKINEELINVNSSQHKRVKI